MAPGGRDLGDFVILGEAGDIHNSTSMSNYCDKQYGDLGRYVKMRFSAWTEVWSGSNCARASIMAPGGRGLGDF